MSLTKSDLQQIRGVVREEVDERLEQKLKPVRVDLETLKKNLSGLEKNVNELGKDMKGVKKDLKYIKKTVSLTVKNYDEADVKLERRVQRIEQHLALSEEN